MADARHHQADVLDVARRRVAPVPRRLRRGSAPQYEIYARGGRRSLRLLYDGEPGADVISAAADTQQADVVFSIARQMVERSPSLQKVVQIYKRELIVPSTQSSYRVISSESYTKH